MQPFVIHVAGDLQLHCSDVSKQMLEEMETRIMARISDLAAIANGIGDQLEKAKAEIEAAIAALKNADPDISPEGQAALERLVTVAQAFDDLNPDVTPEPTPTPAPAAAAATLNRKK
jgi:hypothetical protein